MPDPIIIVPLDEWAEYARDTGADPAAAVVCAHGPKADSGLLLVCVPHVDDDLAEYGLYKVFRDGRGSVAMADSKLADACGCVEAAPDDPSYGEVPQALFEELLGDALCDFDPYVVATYDGVCPTPIAEDTSWIEDLFDSARTLGRGDRTLDETILAALA